METLVNKELSKKSYCLTLHWTGSNFIYFGQGGWGQFLPPPPFLRSKELVSQKVYKNKNEVTSVKLVLFKYVMSFETIKKVDQLYQL